MSVSNDFLTYVIEQLTPFARVLSRRMFGGVGLYADGLFFGLIADDVLFFKVDDTNRIDYEQRGAKPFQPFPDKPEISISYYDVPADILDDRDELIPWARKSVAVALAANERKMAGQSKRKPAAKKKIKNKKRAKMKRATRA